MKIDKDLLLHYLLLSDQALGAIIKERDELRDESDKLLGDLIDSEKERDALCRKLDGRGEEIDRLGKIVCDLASEKVALQAKLDYAKEVLVILRDTDIDDADRFINDVLKRMEGE